MRPKSNGLRSFHFQLVQYRVAQGTFLVTLKPSYFDGLQFADAKRREQSLPPSAVVAFSSAAGVAKDRSPAVNIDADRTLITFKEMPITQVEANHDALKVAHGEIGGLAVEPATLVNDFEGRQSPALLDIVEFDGFIWESGRNRRHCFTLQFPVQVRDEYERQTRWIPFA